MVCLVYYTCHNGLVGNRFFRIKNQLVGTDSGIYFGMVCRPTSQLARLDTLMVFADAPNFDSRSYSIAFGNSFRTACQLNDDAFLSVGAQHDNVAADHKP